MKNLAIIYPNQLFEIENLPYRQSEIDLFVLVEDPIFFRDKERNLRFNMLKLIYQRACMKYYQSYLESNNIPVVYINWDPDPALLFRYIDKKFGSDNLLYIIDPVDYLVEERIVKYSKKYNQDTQFYQTPMFLLTDDDLNNYVENMKREKFYQYSFYIWYRKNHNILLDKNGKPIGGKYSYDKFNREPIPNKNFAQFIRDAKIKVPKKLYHNAFYEDAISYCEQTFENNYIENYQPDNIYYYPITHKDCKSHFKNFLRYKLEYFGQFQDAIDFSQNQMFHSVMSAALNIGLVTPQQMIDTILDYYYQSKKDNPDLYLDVEAYIRQLNWREYSRLIYRYQYKDIVNANYFGNDRHLTKEWYNGTTGIEPIDQTIKMAFRNGYLHHIMRLMVMCNFMNLCQIHPYDVYCWFMEFSLDSYDWVMINNVYSMGLYADGGLTTTKPYISSSGYISRMSNAHKDGHWNTIWDTLYYYFIHVNYDKFVGRGKIYQSQWNKKSDQRQIIRDAKKIIGDLTD